MLNNTELLKLYNAEKTAMDMPSEPFPSFKEWKAAYMKDRAELLGTDGTVTVDADTAIKMADEEINAADQPKAENKQTVRKVIKVKEPKIEKKSTPTEKKVSKKDLAVAIYKEMMVDNVHPVRKDVIARFMTEVNMTQAGASTYWFNIKKELTVPATAE